ncbi:hypothetical protein KJ865_03455, partial [Myxococcota bacterium]|nr:hypothetical protein [Myxococcota bacterium]
MRHSLLALFTLLFLNAACDENTSGNSNCGDGVVDIGEDCDGDDLAGESCPGLGYYGGDPSCTEDCTLDISACEAEGRCGDGVFQEDQEECEDGDLRGQSCETLGMGSGVLGCSNTCSFDYSECSGFFNCGNGSVEGGEECDGSDLNQQTCLSLGFYGGELSCLSGCQFDLADCATYGACGDGIIDYENGESCDGTNIVGSCGGMGYRGGELHCTEDCQVDDSECREAGMCGDGIVQSTAESCDGTNLDGQTCESLGYFPGELACLTEYCTWDVSDCQGRRFTRVTSGLDFSCALDTEGDAWCWGRNNYGQLGVNDTLQRDVPTAVVMPWGLAFLEISCGGYSCCALANDGQFYCWGQNTFGQLGTAEENGESVLVPGQVSTVLSFGPNLMVAVGETHACAVKSNNGLYCWGDNTSGKCGQPASQDKLYTPTAYPISGEMLSQGVRIATVTLGNNHTCVIDTADKVWCMGNNEHGQLGIGTSDATAHPVFEYVGDRIPGAVVSIEAGALHTCAINDAGQVWCWGEGANGQLGSNVTESATPLQADVGSSTPARISCGGTHTCMVDTAGASKCTGNGTMGALGD